MKDDMCQIKEIKPQIEENISQMEENISQIEENISQMEDGMRSDHLTWRHTCVVLDFEQGFV